MSKKNNGNTWGYTGKKKARMMTDAEIDAELDRRESYNLGRVGDHALIDRAWRKHCKKVGHIPIIGQHEIDRDIYPYLRKCVKEGWL